MLEPPLDNNGAGFLGPTLSNIVAEQFRRLKFGDRLFYKNPLAGFTEGTCTISENIWSGYHKMSTNEELFCKTRYRHFQNSRDKKVIFTINRFSVTVRRFKLQDIKIERWKFNLVIKLFCFIYQERRHLLFCFDEIFLSKNRYRVLQTSSSVALKHLFDFVTTYIDFS